MKEQPCVKCPERKYYAMFYDMHFSGEDCPYECEEYEKWKSEQKDGDGDAVD